MVHGKPNPNPKPRGGQGTRNCGNLVSWLPTIWAVVESKKGAPNETTLSCYGNANRGTLADVGMTIIMLIADEQESDIKRYQSKTGTSVISTAKHNTIGTKYGRALGNYIFERLGTKSWCVIPALEVIQWLTQRIAQSTKPS